MWKTNAAARTEREKTAEADLANLPPIAAHAPTVLIPRDFWPIPIVTGTLVFIGVNDHGDRFLIRHEPAEQFPSSTP